MGLFLIASLLALVPTQALACSPSEAVCSYDNQFYRYTIEKIESSLAPGILKITELDKFDSGKLRSNPQVTFENISSEPLYFVEEVSTQETYSIPVNGKQWLPWRMDKGKPALCGFMPSESAKRNSLAALGNDSSWDCQESFDTCGYSNNHHPFERSISPNGETPHGLDYRKRKAPSSAIETDTYQFLYREKLENVKIRWSTRLNDNYLHASCEQDIVLKKCAGKKDCSSITWQIGVDPKYLRFGKPQIITSKNYRISLRRPALTSQLFFGKKPKQLTNEDKEFMKIALTEFKPPTGFNYELKDTLDRLEKDSGGMPLPAEMVMAEVLNNTLALHAIQVLDLRVEGK
jgi:hypothetical protein